VKNHSQIRLLKPFDFATTRGFVKILYELPFWVDKGVYGSSTAVPTYPFLEP